MGTPKNENTKKSTIVTLRNGEKFIEPEMQDLFPELYAMGFECLLSKFHLDNLCDVLFRSANHRSTSHYFKKKSGFSRSVREDIYYHINGMLNHHEKNSTIIDYCNQFEAVCEQFLSYTHPLSLRLLIESKNVIVNENVLDDIDVLDNIDRILNDNYDSDSDSDIEGNNKENNKCTGYNNFII